MAADWYNKEPITLKDDLAYHCKGMNRCCNGHIEAPGISVNLNCSSTTEYPDLNITRNEDFSIFIVGMTLSNDTADEASVSYKADFVEPVDDNCIATLVHRKCSIYAVLTNYSIHVTNVVHVEERNIPYRDSTLRISDPGDRHNATPREPAGTLRGLMVMYNTYYSSYMLIEANSSRSTESKGIFAQSLRNYQSREDTDTKMICTSCWKDPTRDLLNAMDESHFRLALICNKRTGRKTDPPSIPSSRNVPVTIRQGRLCLHLIISTLLRKSHWLYWSEAGGS